MEQFLVTTNMKVLPHLFHKKYNCWYFYFLVCFWQSFLHHHHINIKQFWKSNRESLQKYWKIHEMVRSDPYDQILTILQEIYNEENLEVKRDPLIIILGKTGWTAEANFLGGPGRSPLPAGICASRILWGPNHPPRTRDCSLLWTYFISPGGTRQWMTCSYLFSMGLPSFPRTSYAVPWGQEVILYFSVSPATRKHPAHDKCLLMRTRMLLILIFKRTLRKYSWLKSKNPELKILNATYLALFGKISEEFSIALYYSDK